jgi:hypothetical protein
MQRSERNIVAAENYLNAEFYIGYHGRQTLILLFEFLVFTAVVSLATG